MLHPNDAPLPTYELDRSNAWRRRRVDLRLYRHPARAGCLLGRCIRYVSKKASFNTFF